MKELIKIAFSAFDMRLEECEKQIKRISRELDVLNSYLRGIQENIKEINSEIENKTPYKDEVEEYKFGE